MIQAQEAHVGRSDVRGRHLGCPFVLLLRATAVSKTYYNTLQVTSIALPGTRPPPLCSRPSRPGSGSSSQPLKTQSADGRLCGSGGHGFEASGYDQRVTEPTDHCTNRRQATGGG